VRGEPLWSVIALSLCFAPCLAISRFPCPSAADYSVGWNRACLCVHSGVCVRAASVSVGPPATGRWRKYGESGADRFPSTSNMWTGRRVNGPIHLADSPSVIPASGTLHANANLIHSY